MTDLLEQNQVFSTPEDEQIPLNKLETIFDSLAPETIKELNIVSSSGEQIKLPPTLFPMLHQLVYYLAQGRAVGIVPMDKQLTTQEAADILNVSRPFLVKLLEEGKIPFTMVGNQRRVRADHLMAFKVNYKMQQRQARHAIEQIDEEMGLDED